MANHSARGGGQGLTLSVAGVVLVCLVLLGGRPASPPAVERVSVSVTRGSIEQCDCSDCTQELEAATAALAAAEAAAGEAHAAAEEVQAGAVAAAAAAAAVAEEAEDEEKGGYPAASVAAEEAAEEADGEDMVPAAAEEDEGAAGPAAVQTAQQPVTQLLSAGRSYAAVKLACNHKTGTVQALCIIRAVRRVTDIDVAHFETNATTSQMAEALARFPAGLPGILRASNPVAQECFYGNPRYGGFRCPQPEVPCNASGAPLLALDSSNSSCFMHLPQPSRGALGVVHFLRNPWDIVVSAYWYHSQKKAPEGWLNGKWEDFFRLMGKTGVPLQRLADLGLGAVQQHAGQSYAEVLRALPDEQGVQLEFWRSAPAMYAMARQYGILQHHPDAQQVQFEQMMASFEATWRGILQRYYPQVLERVMKGVQECDPGSWDQEKVAVSAHVTSSKHPPEAKDRLLRVLATQPDIRRHLCELTPAVGYPNPEGLCESSTD